MKDPAFARYSSLRIALALVLAGASAAAALAVTPSASVTAIPAVQAFTKHPTHCLPMLYVVENQTASEAQAFEAATRAVVAQIRSADAGLSDFDATLALKGACDAQAATGYFGTGSVNASAAAAR